MKRISIDMDEVMADFAPAILDLYNRHFEDALTVEDLQGQRLWRFRSDRTREILDFIDDPAFFRELPVIEGSQEVIRELSERYEIFIATAAMEHPTSFAAKFDWLKEHFPFLSDRNFVFCGDKSVIRADYLIDDNVKNLKSFTGQGILFTAPYNVHETGYVRVNNWQEVREYFLEASR